MPADSHQDSTQVTDTSQLTPPQETVSKDGSSTRNLIFFALLVLIIVLPIRLYVAKPFIVSGASMFPTFDTWHYLIIDQLTYKLTPPSRGDVIVFRFPQNPSRFFIKRIIGLPNETVQLIGTVVTIFNDTHKEGFVIEEPYVTPENMKKTELTMQLGDNEYFVMGDNRKASADSRYWGPLESYRIIGRAYIRLFPFSDLGILPGATTYNIISESE
ncbi:MAG: signal peptidase I [Candidatus Pacebacteria bacterium]|nr:signal peptidase I [Candidatus Paceibacterota bacterium]